MGKHISIILMTDENRFSQTYLQSAVEQCVDRVEQELKLKSGPLEIEIYDNRQEWIDNHTRLNEEDLFTWVSGDSGRMIRVVADCSKGIGNGTLAGMLCHESVHHIVRRYTGPHIPAWLDEGLAVVLVQELPKKYLAALSRALAEQALLPLELLEHSFSRFDRGLKSLAYAQSGSLVRYIVAAYGYPFIREILDGCRRGDRLEHLLKSKALTLYLLEQEWQRWLPDYLEGSCLCMAEEGG